MEELAVSKNLNLAELNLVEMDELWEEAKVSEK
jgi:XTP/dITP diphosphohydrolase